MRTGALMLLTASALSLATGDWVLSIDADETVSPALADEIERALATPAADA